MPTNSLVAPANCTSPRLTTWCRSWRVCPLLGYKDTVIMSSMPSHILQWMNFRTFGSVNPAVDAYLISARSSSLQCWKKEVTFFHPNKLMVWSACHNEGNPTRSVEINNVIKRVKKIEKETWRGISDLKGDHRIGILLVHCCIQFFAMQVTVCCGDTV